MTATMEHSRASRVPASLQTVFLTSNRGNDIHKPPPEQMANRVFGGRTWFWKRTRCSRDSTKNNHSKISPDNKGKMKKGEHLTSCLKESKSPATPTMSPQVYLDSMIRARGYSTKRFKTLQSAYYNKPTSLQKSSHSVYLVELIRNGDADLLGDILTSGISPNPCNQFGESLVHMVSRRGDHKLLQVFVDSGASLQVADDYGRTPLHDACWASEPAFDTVKIIMKVDPHLMRMADSRGAVPLSYVSKEHWPAWIRFLEEHKDQFWPQRDLINEGEEPPPPLTLLKPNERPLPSPTDELTPELAALVCSGKMEPDEAQFLMRRDELLARALDSDDESDSSDYDDEDDSLGESFCSRATFDEDEMADILASISCSTHRAKPMAWTR